VKYTKAEHRARIEEARRLEAAGVSRSEIKRRIGMAHGTMNRALGPAPRRAQFRRYNEREKAKVKNMIDLRYSYEQIEKITGIRSETINKWFGPSPFPRGTMRPEQRYRKYSDEQYAEAVRLRMKEGKSNQEISDATGISISALQTHMGGTPRRLGGLKPWPEGLHQRARYLKDLEWTISEIGKELGVPRSTVGQWLGGNRVKDKGADSSPSHITDHAFMAPTGEPWGRCTQCGMAEAAHAEALISYDPDDGKIDWRCPNCVTANIAVCGHDHDTWAEEAEAVLEELEQVNRSTNE
jgi:transposase-like protein/transcriptional regulator with XRE-family HTH domain